MRDGRRMPDPSILVTVATRTDPSLAPANSSTLFALEPVPNLTAGIDWRREAGRARDDLARRVAALGYPDAVEVEAAYDPETWQALGLSQGTPFAMSHRFRQSGPFRRGAMPSARPACSSWAPARCPAWESRWC